MSYPNYNIPPNKSYYPPPPNPHPNSTNPNETVPEKITRDISSTKLEIARSNSQEIYGNGVNNHQFQSSNINGMSHPLTNLNANQNNFYAPPPPPPTQNVYYPPPPPQPSFQPPPLASFPINQYGKSTLVYFFPNYMFILIFIKSFYFILFYFLF